MNNNVKKWGPLVAAIVLGGIAAKAGYNAMSKQPAKEVVVQKVTHVIGAKEDIASGASLKAEDLAVTSVPDATAPNGTFDTVDRLSNRVTTVPVTKGQPIFETMLAPTGSGQGLTAVVPSGMRAVTMEINEYSGVAGMLVPGCRVDVLSTFPNEAGQMMTRTICSSLQVIGIGRKYGEAVTKQPAKGQVPRDGETEPPLAHSVTLLTTPREAELLDLAAHTGAPRLVLRSSRDDKADGKGLSDGVTVAELRKVAAKKNWVNVIAALFNPNLAAPAAAPTTQPNGIQTVSDFENPISLFGNQKTKYRQITVIRATKEEQVKVEDAKPRHGGIIVDTDTSETSIPAPRRAE